MTMVAPPHVDERRRRELRAELFARARMWMPEWRPGGLGSDVLASFLEIAARLDAEVTQRLDRVPEKSFRGFLHWLGRRGRSGQAARMPVVFKMSERAEPVFATKPIQLQADAGGKPVIFETEASIQLIASRLDAVVASEGRDTFYVAFPGLAELAPPTPAPSTWPLLTPAKYGATQVQLDPPEGLAVDMMLIDDAKRKYRVTEVKNGLVRLSDPLGSSPKQQVNSTGFYSGNLAKATTFAPFDGEERDRQEHALYIGAKDLLDIETAALIRLEGELPAGCDWSYWGKVGNSESGWWSLLPDGNTPNLFRKEKPGAIEEKEINAHTSRWLRATPADRGIVDKSAGGIALAINCTGDAGETAQKSPIKIEAVANTTPVVLNEDFYPFGREPRQFDSFYISGPEAFGKPKALVDIEIALADGFGSPMNAVSMVKEDNSQAFTLAAGVGDDFSLRMVYVASPSAGAPIFPLATRPPSEPGQPARLERQKVGAAVGNKESDKPRFSATDGREVWIWTSTYGLDEFDKAPMDNLGVWERFGRPDEASRSKVVETCLLWSDSSLKIYAVLENGQVHWRFLQSGSLWQPLANGNNGHVDNIKRLVPFERASDLPGRITDELGFAGFNADGMLTSCKGAGGLWEPITAFVAIPVDKPIPYPTALRQGESRQIFTSATREKNRKTETTIEAWRLGSSDAEPKPILVEGVVGDAMSPAWFASGGFAVMFATLEKDGRRPLKLWAPKSDPIDLPMPPTTLLIAQAPVRLARGHMLPLTRGAVALTEQDNKVINDKTISAFKSIALTEAGSDFFPKPALLELSRAPLDKFSLVTTVEDLGFELPKFHKRALDDVPGRIHALDAQRTGTIADGTPFKVKKRILNLDPKDELTKAGMKLCLLREPAKDSDPADTLYDVEMIKEEGKERYAVLKPDIVGEIGDTQFYFLVLASEDASFAIRPTVQINGPVTGHIDVTKLIVKFDATRYVPGLRQPPFHDKTPDETKDWLVLAASWVGDAPETGTAVELIQPGEASQATTPPAMRNPELSWEYWNGTTWWQIPGLEDFTNNLVKSGNVKFCVPADIKPSDVVGRPGTWIRARLVGGDYGQETVEVVTKYHEDGSSTQTVKRDPSTIRAPYVVDLSVTYELCCAVAPDRILTFDSGGYRDQTEINRAENARIEVFQRLSTGIRQIRPAESLEPAAPTPDRKCGAGASGDSGNTDASDEEEKGKAIYLGFSEPLHGQGVSLLVLVEEALRPADPRLVVDVFADGAFRPVVAKDETRALNESGIITFSIPTPMQRVTLFGRPLHWLRLSPDRASDDWAPKICGVYLNGVWASAGETHRNELVGRSDGSPSQVFRLVHRDVVDDTLELRIKEPLGDDDIDALRRRDPTDVLPAIDLWDGPWIRWRKGELATAAADARIFDFDAALGVITFGDGLRGAIPPIGADNIVAVTYRSGADASGNLVGRWAKPNLISPLRGVQEVVTPQGAAGGSDAQNVEQALLFAPANIAMRDRAVTLADFERQAVQSSPDIVQAKALVGRKGLRLIAVRRGPDPNPTAAMRRALERYLEQRSSSAFSRPGALSVEGPVPVQIGLSVSLTVQDLALAGEIAEAVKSRIIALLDTATGGLDGLGWPMGLMVSEADLSAAISEVPDVLEIDRLIPRRLDDSAAAIHANELVMLSEGDLSIVCVQSEEEAA